MEPSATLVSRTIESIETLVQEVWDSISEVPVVVFKLSAIDKEVLFPMGAGSNPLPALEAARRLTKTCDRSETIRGVTVTKRSPHVA